MVEYSTKHSMRPELTVRVWTWCFDHMCTDIDEILLRRDQLAGQLGIRSDHVSSIITELEGFGAIIRKRQRIAGMQGLGIVRYFMDSRVVANLTGRHTRPQ